MSRNHPVEPVEHHTAKKGLCGEVSYFPLSFGDVSQKMRKKYQNSHLALGGTPAANTTITRCPCLQQVFLRERGANLVISFASFETDITKRKKKRRHFSAETTLRSVMLY